MLFLGELLDAASIDRDQAELARHEEAVERDEDQYAQQPQRNVYVERLPLQGAKTMTTIMPGWLVRASKHS